MQLKRRKKFSLKAIMKFLFINTTTATAKNIFINGQSFKLKVLFSMPLSTAHIHTHKRGEKLSPFNFFLSQLSNKVLFPEIILKFFLFFLYLSEKKRELEENIMKVVKA